MKTPHAIVGSGAAVLALSFALVGCAPASPGASGAAGTWGAGGEGQPQLVLAADGKLSGTDGCNNLIGNWTSEGTTVDFGEVGSTMMYCEGVDTWLVDLATGRIDGSTLHILDVDGTEIGTLTRN